MTIRDRIRELRDHWHKPAVTLPIKRTWDKWAAGAIAGIVNTSVVWFLEFLLWVLKRK